MLKQFKKCFHFVSDWYVCIYMYIYMHAYVYCKLKQNYDCKQKEQISRLNYTDI